MLTCQIEGCGKAAHARQMCQMHYQRWRKNGDPRKVHEQPSIPDRFWSKVDASGDCWIWTGTKNASGYGVLCLHRSEPRVTAHRYSAMLHFGMFDVRLHVLHTCDVRDCVNPKHLYLGTNQENVADMVERRRHWAHRMDACKRGHAYTEENTRWYGSFRICRQCERDRKSVKLAPAADRTHCPHGHPYDEANTMWSKRGHRRCRECNRLRGVRHRQAALVPAGAR